MLNMTMPDNGLKTLDSIKPDNVVRPQRVNQHASNLQFANQRLIGRSLKELHLNNRHIHMQLLF